MIGLVGPADIRYRLQLLDDGQQPIATGPWVTFVLTLEELPPGMFEVQNIQLVPKKAIGDAVPGRRHNAAGVVRNVTA